MNGTAVNSCAFIIVNFLNKWIPRLAGTPPYPNGVPRRLNGTLQGRRQDIPPEDWIPEELIRYQVVGGCNLSEGKLVIFAKMGG